MPATHRILPSLCLALFACAVVAQEPAPKTEPKAEPKKAAEQDIPAEIVAGNLRPTTAGPLAPYPADSTETAQKRASDSLRAMPLDYRLLVVEALKRFQARDFAGSLIYADRADQLQLPTVWTLNIRGAVAIEKRQFEEGTKYCHMVLSIDPAFFPAQFNLCEIPFLQGRYPEARQMWEKLLANYPVNPAQAKEDGTPELLTYRIFLCYLLEKDDTNAKQWLEKLPFPSVTPAYAYGNAAWERQHGREDKWQEWLSQAEFIWPEIKRANFTDVLIQFGWIKPPFGEAPPVPQ